MNQFTFNGRTYRQQFRKCGSDSCKCKEGDLYSGEDCHGPYWYSMGDFSALKYIGKSLPADVVRVQDLLKSEAPRLAEIRKRAQERADQLRQEWEDAREEARTINALINGQYADPRKLRALELEEFILE